MMGDFFSEKNILWTVSTYVVAIITHRENGHDTTRDGILFNARSITQAINYLNIEGFTVTFCTSRNA
jgi:hypothetical protein